MTEQEARQSFAAWLSHGDPTNLKHIRWFFAWYQNSIDRYRNRLARVQEAESRFRVVLGLPADDGTRLIPADAPTTALFEPDYQLSVAEALASRTEVQRLRTELKAQQLRLVETEIACRSLLRFLRKYDILVAIKQSDGSAILPSMAQSLTGTQKQSHRTWIPLDKDDDPWEIKRMSLVGLARAYVILRNQELKTERKVAALFQALQRYQDEILVNSERQKALAQQLERLSGKAQFGKLHPIFVLQAQSDLTLSSQLNYSATCNYNIALAEFHYFKGTIRQYNHVEIADTDIPQAK